MKNENEVTCVILKVAGGLCLLGAAGCVIGALLLGGGNSLWIMALSALATGFVFSAVSEILRKVTETGQRVEEILMRMGKRD